MEDHYELEALYASDPVGTTNAGIAHAASIAAEEVAAITGSRHAAELRRLRVSQTESAALTAIGEIEAKYGADEWQRLQPKVEKRISDSPHLIPEEARTSPTALARSLEDVYKLVRGEAAEAISVRRGTALRPTMATCFGCIDERRRRGRKTLHRSATASRTNRRPARCSPTRSRSPTADRPHCRRPEDRSTEGGDRKRATPAEGHLQVETGGAPTAPPVSVPTRPA